MPSWFEGLSFEEIERRIPELPQSRVPGGVIEVPKGFMEWLSGRGARFWERTTEGCETRSEDARGIDHGNP